VKGQHQKLIAREMGIGEQRLSVITNSPLFQEELQKRLREEDEEIIQRIIEADRKRIERAVAVAPDCN
jgi:hypothetical protein